jgi:hypothetical protein
MRKTIVSLLALSTIAIVGATGCVGNATVGVGVTHVPKDAATTCKAHCNEVGLSLNAVVIMADNVGCVCSAVPEPTASGAAAGGMAAILRQHSRSSSNQTSSRPK